MSLILFFMMILTGINSAYSAGQESGPGNGGDVIELDGKYYVLDLVESGVEKHPVVDLSVKHIPEIETAIRTGLPFNFFSDKKKYDQVLQILISKLSEVAQTSWFGYNIAGAIKLYEYKLVDYDLKDVTDENTVINKSKYRFIQAAIRSNNVIYMNQDVIDKMDAAQVAALFIHEAVYALKLPNTKGCRTYEQNNLGVKEVVGTIFSKKPKNGYDLNVVHGFKSYFPQTKIGNFSAINSSSGSVSHSPKLVFTIATVNQLTGRVGFVSEKVLLQTTGTSESKSEHLRKSIVWVCNAFAGERYFQYFDAHDVDILSDVSVTLKTQLDSFFPTIEDLSLGAKDENGSCSSYGAYYAKKADQVFAHIPEMNQEGFNLQYLNEKKVDAFSSKKGFTGCFNYFYKKLKNANFDLHWQNIHP